MKSLPIKFETFEVEQTYLRPKEVTERGYTYLRRRGQNGIYTYTLSTVRSPSNDDSDVVILERSVSGREYIALMRQADPDRFALPLRGYFGFSSTHLTWPAEFLLRRESTASCGITSIMKFKASLSLTLAWPSWTLKSTLPVIHLFLGLSKFVDQLLHVFST